jgi:hypothetical protein
MQTLRDRRDQARGRNRPGDAGTPKKTDLEIALGAVRCGTFDDFEPPSLRGEFTSQARIGVTKAAPQWSSRG